MNGKVAVSYIHPGQVSGLFMDSMLFMIQHDYKHQRRVLKGEFLSMSSGPRIASARNQITQHFLDMPSKPDWLLMLDADMTFPADLVDRLVTTANSADIKIIGGLCFGGGRSGQVFPTLYRMTPPDEDGNCVQVIEDYPEDALVKVDATGCACLMVHRTVLEDVHKLFGTVQTKAGERLSPSPWFAESVYAGREFGEDWTFCMRAQQAGFDIYVHTGIRLGHVKPQILDESAFIQFKRDRARLGSPEAVSQAFKAKAFGG